MTQTHLLTDVYMEALRELAPATGSYLNEVSSRNAPVTGIDRLTTVSRVTFMSQTSRRLSGETITLVCFLSRDKLILATYSGVLFASGAKDGESMVICFVEYRRTVVPVVELLSTRHGPLLDCIIFL